MKNLTDFFHKISYLQYPMMLLGCYFAITPYFNGFENFIGAINSMMLFMGIGISFSTLQDTHKTQNDFSKRVWENPTKGKFFLLLMGFFTLCLLIGGLIGFFLSESSLLNEVCLGLIVLGIGFLGLLKAAAEMFENHRLDKK
jgi:hypothetical protein